MTPDQLAWIAGGTLLALVVLTWTIVYRKGRPFMAGDVFRASRLSKGNRLLPTQVAITPTSVVHFTPQWIGRLEQSIHIAHVASVRIDTHLLFSDVLIETSGGTDPIKCYGHRKRDAVRMKELVERYQSAYFRTPAEGRPATVGLMSGQPGSDKLGVKP
jgi:hypothetical protein